MIGPSAVRLVVAAEVRIYRDGLGEALGRRPGLAVLGLASSAPDCVALVRLARPDVLVCDAAMQGSLRAMRTVAEETGVRVLALGVAERVDDVLACAAAGASGYVTRDASLADLVAALDAMLRSELVIDPTMAAALLRRAGDLVRAEASGQEPAVHLTARETEIVSLIDAGLSNKQIAARLSIQPSTVKNHVHNILEKLQVTARDDAAAVVRSTLRI